MDYQNSELSILFVDDKEIKDLNKRFRGKDQPTDVLSFPQHTITDHFNINPYILGDIVISTETARKYAQKDSKELDLEITELLIHGLLHLLGFDHENDERSADEMRTKERELLTTIYE